MLTITYQINDAAYTPTEASPDLATLMGQAFVSQYPSQYQSWLASQSPPATDSPANEQAFGRYQTQQYVSQVLTAFTVQQAVTSAQTAAQLAAAALIASMPVTSSSATS